MLQFNTGPDMMSMADAITNDMLIPDVASNFSEWIEGNNQMESFGLSPRQRQCVDPGYYPCSNGQRCCPQGDTCVPGGCCRGNAQQCGSSKCYFPSSQICCPSGIACKKGQNCVDGGCCESGESKCGSSGCYNPKTSVCCGSSSIHCPKGYDCMPGGGCCPAGQKRCGNSKCYDPKKANCCTGPGTVWACEKGKECCSNGSCANSLTEKCCKNGACQEGTTCCENECCRSNGYCASDGYCKTCPAATRTVSSTDTTTKTVMRTVRVTTDIEPDTGNAPEFTCVPMTATNDVGATLELDDGCILHYEPPEATTTQNNVARLRREAPTPPVVSHPVGLLARQASCTPSTTFTRTIWETETFTETGIRTVVVQGEDATFSCPEMEVTNDVGDTLVLDGDCVLEFTPAEPTTVQEEVPTQARPTANGQGPDIPVGPSGTASADDDSSGSVSEVGMFLMTGFFAISVLWTAL
ncbi:hypothetical protein FPOA_03654 [Fusarium poae]|uniref:Uncharacterized protein n=1 Tax=Fusarium poae TaxID=36050 RepID=A0A1B8ARD0_FUSPO|nr:hypothetical protein FPOA_03654 [Fusarium poae]